MTRTSGRSPSTSLERWWTGAPASSAKARRSAAPETSSWIGRNSLTPGETSTNLPWTASGGARFPLMVAAHNRDLVAAGDLGFRTAFVFRRNERGPNQTSDLKPERDFDIVS